MMPEGPSFPVCSTFVQELFQAQYRYEQIKISLMLCAYVVLGDLNVSVLHFYFCRSSLTCPHCQKQSNTFDPFLCISLPIPLPHTR